MPSSRFSASRLPRTASPSRFTFRETFCDFTRSNDFANLLSLASIIRWLTILRRTLRAIGTTIAGNTGANEAPIANAARMGSARKLGTRLRRLRRFFAATFKLSGRTTPSTKPTVNERPLLSRKTDASCAAENDGLMCAASLSH